LTSSHPGDLKAGLKKFRPELEGVRAVAAMLVAIYHIWVGSVSGGVDVFFIVSGYLITTSLLSKMEKEGHIRFFDYLLGLGKRLFPNAFIVLMFVIAASFFLLPQVQWRQIISEVLASAAYFQNWNLALDAVDYLAQHNEASPLQHFWALSIQGQFYVTWPLVIYASFIMAVKWFKTPPRKTLLLVLSLIFVMSITYSIYITAVNQPWAYFDTFARVWEFSLGGALSLLLPYAAIRKPISIGLGWTGLCIIALTGILLPVSTVFPGYAALLPICGVIFIIISAENNSGLGVARLLGSKPFQFLGSISYAFYLWHWPLLLFYLVYFRKEDVSALAGIAILLLTFALSLLATRMVEAPIRKLSLRQSRKKIVFLLAFFALPVVLASLSWSLYAEHSRQMVAQATMQHVLDQEAAGQIMDMAQEDSEAKRVIELQEEPELVQDAFQQLWGTQDEIDSALVSASLADIQNLPVFYGDRCYVDMKNRGMKKCSYGETSDPDYTLALVGGSRSGHWFPALEQFALEEKLRIDVYNKDACRFTTDDFDGKLSASCIEWNKLAAEALLQDPPDVLMTTANVDRDAYIPEGYIDMWNKFDGITTIFAIRDTPSMPEDVPACVELYGGDNCSVPRDKLLSAKLPWAHTENLPSNVYFVDMSDYLCDSQSCKSVINNAVVYRDKFHLSTQFAAMLAEPIRKELLLVLEKIKAPVQ